MPFSPTAASIASWILLGSLLLAVLFSPHHHFRLCFAPNNIYLPVQALLTLIYIVARRVPAHHSGSLPSLKSIRTYPAWPVTTKRKWLITAGHARALPCEWLRQAEYFCH
ncbi:hypothetical protein GGI43DRAFT_309483 [Trichoderma evansii]